MQVREKCWRKGSIYHPHPTPLVSCEETWVSSQFLPSIGCPGGGHIWDIDTDLFLGKRALLGGLWDPKDHPWGYPQVESLCLWEPRDGVRESVQSVTETVILRMRPASTGSGFSRSSMTWVVRILPVVLFRL